MICPLAGVDELWVVDFEFIHPDGERPTEVHTLVALELQTGQRIEVHGAAELQALEAAPYRCDQGAVVVAYAAKEAKHKREPIPEDVRIAVWRRDQGKCVQCDSNERLEYDHIIPVSKGGSNTVRNIQLLCETCNRKKSDSI